MMYIWVLLGAIVLGVAIAWAALNNRTTPQQDELSDKATREFREKADRINKAEGR